jgi:gliding motility-associated-like protein
MGYPVQSFEIVSLKINTFHTPSVMIRLAYTLSFLFIIQLSWGQEYSITGPDLTACGGYLLDSGLNGSPYGNNETEEITVCAEAPETIVNLYWTIFNLGDGDIIEIYDGSTTGAPIIGTYSTNELQTTDITSTNPEGCLTVVFTSDGNDVGNFAAVISCGLPCERPVSVITSAEDPMPLKICPGETVTFDASNSIFFNGTSIQDFTWIFDDGATDVTNWPIVSHTFNEPGGYKVQLAITDDNACSNNNLNDYIVLVSTYPNFNLITEVTSLCSGGEALLGVTNIAQDSTYYQDSLNNWISDNWADLPDADLGGDFCIQDGTSDCFENSITLSAFAYDAVIDDLSDFESFYINFEHSFMNDLSITFFCPNGQSINVHQQGGGGTFLGIPIDDFGGDPCPIPLGEGWDYFWAPTATNGTWADEADLLGLGATLPSGTYQSADAWTNLIGCPLNGTWTMEICDIFIIDDGNIFTWNVFFNSDLYGDLLEFTPVYGPDCDSTYWEGSNITTFSDGCDWINIDLPNAGEYFYTYTATNDFGCSFDTTISIVVSESPLITAGPDLSFDCLNPELMLQGGFQDILPATCNGAGGTFNYSYGNNENLSWTFCPDPGFEDYSLMTFSLISGEMEALYEEFSVYDGPDNTYPLLQFWEDGNASGLSWTATNETGCITFEFTSDISNSAMEGTYNPWEYAVGCIQDAPDFVWEWTPAEFLITPDQPTSEVDGLPYTQTFTLFGYPVGQPGCGSTDEMVVTVSTDMVIDIEEFYEACRFDFVHVLAPQIDGGLGPYTFQWESFDGEIINAEDFVLEVTEPMEYCVTVTDMCNLEQSACTSISVYPEVPASFQLEDPLGCEPHFVLMTMDYLEFQDIGSVTWSYGDGESGTTLASANHQYTEAGTYYPSLEIIDINGCISHDTVQSPVVIWPTPFANFYASPATQFLPETDFEFINTTTFGADYHWDFGGLGESFAEDTVFTFPEETAGTYLVWLTAANQYGCADSTFRQVVVEDQIDVYIPNAFTPDYDGINDEWLISGMGFNYDGFKVQIFDRWGALVFETDKIEMAWTGAVGGGEHFAPDGIYNYVAVFIDSQNDIKYEYTGHVTIVR